MSEIATYHITEGELYHYGVRGMKWGVRRNTRLLASHRRNAAINDAKKRYRNNEISKQERKEAIRDAKASKKKAISQMNSTLKNTKNSSDIKKLSKSTSEQVSKEIKGAKVVKFALFANSTISAATIAYAAAGAAAATASMPVLAPVAITSLASTAAVSAGRAYLFRDAIERNI